jgi:dUTP pyrophosphatase
MNYALTDLAEQLHVTLTRAYDGDAGMDLYAVIPRTRYTYERFISEPTVLTGLDIEPYESISIPTGIMCEIPSGYYGQVATKSSLARKGLIVLGGVIDSGYRGEIEVVLYNTTGKLKTVLQGDKIAQLIIIPIWHGETFQVNQTNLSESERGTKGFGSSGSSLHE